MAHFDIHILATVFGIACVGSLIGLDRTAVGQFMISQPIVAGPFTGWLLGDPTSGFVIGAVLELIWVLDMPVGTFVPADSTIGAVSATAIAALGSPGGASLEVIGFCILLTTGMVPFTMLVDDVVRKRNSRLADSVLVVAGPESLSRRVTRAHLSGLAAFFLKSFVLYLVFLPAGLAAVSIFIRMPDQVHRAMSLFVKLLPMLGAGLILRKLSMKTLDRFFISGFVIAAAAGQVLQLSAFVVVLLTITAGWLGARYREQ